MKCFSFIKQYISSRFHQKRGFTITELLTTVAIAGTLSVVGIRSYQSQTNKARSAEAKHSLSFLYTAEKNFHDSWKTYHENLYTVGAIPSGSYHYDVGFGKSVSINDGTTHPVDGFLGTHPLTDSLNIRECTNFHQVCQGDCATTTQTAVGPARSAYFTRASCQVTGGNYVKDYSGTPTADAQDNSFTALAISTIKNTDVWSINESKVVTHDHDGTE